MEENPMEFLCDPANEDNCESCPLNTDEDLKNPWQIIKPCGQQNCWVCAYCAER